MAPKNTKQQPKLVTEPTSLAQIQPQFSFDQQVEYSVVSSDAVAAIPASSNPNELGVALNQSQTETPRPISPPTTNCSQIELALLKTEIELLLVDQQQPQLKITLPPDINKGNSETNDKAQGFLEVTLPYGRERKCLIKLLDSGRYYIEQPLSLILHSNYWVKRAINWQQWLLEQKEISPASSSDATIKDLTGYPKSCQVVGWLFGGTRLILKTKSSRLDRNGFYKLVRFERTSRKGHTIFTARADTSFNFGRTNPYLILNTQIESDTKNQQAWQAEYRQKIYPLRQLEAEAFAALRQHKTIFHHLKTRNHF